MLTLMLVPPRATLFHEKKRKEKDSFVQSEPTEGFALRVYTKDLKSKRKKFVTEAYVTD